MKSNNKRKSSSEAIKEAGYRICPRVSAIGRTKSNSNIRGVKKKTLEEPYWKYRM